MKRIVLINVIVIVLLLVGGGVGAYYYMQSINYISTSNASIDGQAITISAPEAGVLSEWNGTVGKTYNLGQTVGMIRSVSRRVAAAAPATGTIVQQNAVVNSVVGEGTPLARMYDLNNLWVTANIEETKIRDVKLNQVVDISVDAFPGNTMTGKVAQIGLATAGTFSLLPATNATANFTKVTQIIPVTIAIDNYRGLGLAPGMSVYIRIHK